MHRQATKLFHDLRTDELSVDLVALGIRVAFPWAHPK